jgi:ABC-type enterochelin transport system ATPase subunit
MLEIKNLNKTFGHKQILHDLSVQIPASSIAVFRHAKYSGISARYYGCIEARISQPKKLSNSTVSA